jgi:hypothetical protein
MTDSRDFHLATATSRQWAGQGDEVPRWPAARPLGSDLALRYCAMAFGRPHEASAEGGPWSVLEPGWRARIVAGEGQGPAVGPDEALDRLRASLQAQAHVDRARVHPSWLARALQDESPAVRRLLEGLEQERAADPEVAGWVRVLWTERLVGGEPVGPGDPSVIAALAGLPPRATARLAHAIGRAKLALAEGPDDGWPRPQRDRDRHEWYLDRLVARLGGDEARLRRWAGEEVRRSSASGADARRGRALLGLTTLARLLAACDPFRARWALQHLPYAVAKRFRSVMTASVSLPPRLLEVEQTLLQTAWERLIVESRLDVPYPTETMRPPDAS